MALFSSPAMPPLGSARGVMQLGHSALSRLELSMRLGVLALMLLTTFALVRGPFARVCIGERE